MCHPRHAASPPHRPANRTVRSAWKDAAWPGRQPRRPSASSGSRPGHRCRRRQARSAAIAPADSRSRPGWRRHKHPSVWPYTTSEARSERSNCAPTCGPLPCVITRRYPRRMSPTDGLGGAAGVGQLLGDRAFLTCSDERVASNRDQRSLRHNDPYKTLFALAIRLSFSLFARPARGVQTRSGRERDTRNPQKASRSRSAGASAERRRPIF